jgi:hypothetical protein
VGFDAVLTWVDGDDPAHAARRQAFLPPHAKGEPFKAHRWQQFDEVVYCLASIGRFAPWIDRIWVVTDNQTPPLDRLDPALRARITVVDHRTIFQGHDDILPTFNSGTIEMALHRIPGLAECFLYFNDDMFLTGPTEPGDFFTETGLVLRGRFVPDFTGKGMHAIRRRNAAEQAGFKVGHLFQSPHVAHPMRRSIITRYLESHPDVFARNISYRFRDDRQFLITVLVEHLALAQGQAMIRKGRDWTALTDKSAPTSDVVAVQRMMRRLFVVGNRLGCINDIGRVFAAWPPARQMLEDHLITGQARPLGGLDGVRARVLARISGGVWGRARP